METRILHWQDWLELNGQNLNGTIFLPFCLIHSIFFHLFILCHKNEKCYCLICKIYNFFPCIFLKIQILCDITDAKEKVQNHMYLWIICIKPWTIFFLVSKCKWATNYVEKKWLTSKSRRRWTIKKHQNLVFFERISHFWYHRLPHQLTQPATMNFNLKFIRAKSNLFLPVTWIEENPSFWIHSAVEKKHHALHSLLLCSSVHVCVSMCKRKWCASYKMMIKCFEGFQEK